MAYNLCKEVLSQTPVTLIRAVAIARLFEEKYSPKSQNIPLHSTYRSPATTTIPLAKNTVPSTSSNPRPQLPPLLPTPKTKPLHINQRNSNIKYSSPAEKQLRRDKVLCFYYDDKFSPQHNCPNKHLLLLQVDTDSNEVLDPDPSDDSTNDTENPHTEHHLSFNAMKGSGGVGTLHFIGNIVGLDIHIMIDEGSSDSFFQPRIAQFLILPIEPAPYLKVLVGNGQTMIAEGKISKLTIHIQGHELQLPVYLLPVRGADLVLGSSWLVTLGPHVADYASLTLKFFHQGNFITLQSASSQLLALA